MNATIAAVTLSGASVQNLLGLIAVVNTSFVLVTVIYIAAELRNIAKRPRGESVPLV